MLGIRDLVGLRNINIFAFMEQYRKSPRAKWLMYNEGTYFVTVCTRDKKHYFGEVVSGNMILSSLGRYLSDELANAGVYREHIKVPLFVVMPNHFHAIVVVGKGYLSKNPLPQCIDDRCISGYRYAKLQLPVARRSNPLLSSYIGVLKSRVTKYAKSLGMQFEWHGRYHDHAIRGHRDGNKIADYITTNPQRWDADCFYTERQ